MSRQPLQTVALKGLTEISAEQRAIFDAYIRGEIEAGELVTVYQEGRYKQPL
jgi:hypothetical protein